VGIRWHEQTLGARIVILVPMDRPAPELSVIVPTRDRRETVLATLAAIDRAAAGQAVEVVVADDGSGDGTAAAIERTGAALEIEVLCVRRARAGGPAAARNAAVARARSPLLLFLGDDMAPRPGLIERHLRFHRQHPAGERALIGLIAPAPGCDTPFARWLHECGKQFAFAEISAGAEVPVRLFYAANLSLKAELLARAGGFDERFEFGHEERELGIRLERAGIRIDHDPEALADHDHPTDLEATLRRMRGFGRSHRLLCRFDPAEPRPSRPAARHRLAALALTLPAVARVRAAPVRRRTWRFLCEQAAREAFWDELDPPDPAIRVGRRLAELAARDPATGAAAAKQLSG